MLGRSRRVRWAALGVMLVAPAAASAFSPLQDGRDTSWVIGAVAGIVALSLLVVQVLLPTPWLAGLDLRLHRAIGLGVGGLVVAHIAGLYV